MSNAEAHSFHDCEKLGYLHYENEAIISCAQTKEAFCLFCEKLRMDFITYMPAQLTSSEWIAEDMKFIVFQN
jgi:hypothetical protein